MGNAAVKHEFDKRELGQAHLEASTSNKVIDSNCVTNGDVTNFVRRGNSWYQLPRYQEEHNGKEDLVFSITRQRIFASTYHTQVIVDEKNSIIAVLQLRTKGKAITTLVFRPIPAFDGQEPYMDIYKEKEQGKNHPKLYLFAKIQTSGASRCDATYSLLEVHVVYNDPDFAKFQDPPLYRAAKVTGAPKLVGGGIGFVAAVMDGSDPGGENLLGKFTSNEAQIAGGVDMIAAICLAQSVNASGSSARGAAVSGVV